MSLSTGTIAKNTSLYISALTIQKFLSFVYFSYLAHSLGPEKTGKYFFALSFAGMVIAFIDLGLTPVLTREVSKRTEDAKMFLNQIITLKMVFSVVLIALMAIAVPITIHDSLVTQLVFIALAIALMDSFAMSFFAIVRAHQNLWYESMASIVFQCIVIVLGGVAIWYRAPLQIIILALLTASTINLLWAVTVVVKKYGLNFQLVYDSPLVKRLITFALPFAIAAGFIKVYAYIDTILLRFFMGDHAVGIYSIAYKITFAFQFIPMAFVAALYPAFSYFWANDKDGLSKSFARALEYLVIISIPIAVGICALAPAVIPHVYSPAFTQSIIPLIILIVSLPFLFINFPVGSLLNACNRQTRQMVHLGITMVINIILNLIMIPMYGPIGASLASTMSTIFIFCLGWWVAQSMVTIRYKEILNVIIKVLAVSVVMFLVAVFTNRISAWYYAAVLSMIVYAAGLMLTKVVKVADITNFKSLLKP